ncbi:hypothetical protein ACOSQ4_029120 [Xanthoceras sorbifolium]
MILEASVLIFTSFSPGASHIVVGLTDIAGLEESSAGALVGSCTTNSGADSFGVVGFSAVGSVFVSSGAADSFVGFGVAGSCLGAFSSK